jgi:hypothetical protein
VNGDSSGLDDANKAAAETFALSCGGSIVSANDETFFSYWHDALDFYPLGAMCLEYIIYLNEGTGHEKR